MASTVAGVGRIEPPVQRRAEAKAPQPTAKAALRSDSLALSAKATSNAKAAESFGDKFWSGLNHAATKPVQFMFKHMNNVAPDTTGDVTRFGKAELEEILARAKPGDLILWGDATSFVHASVYLGNGEIVHALAARAPEGQKNGVVQEKIEGYLGRVERQRVAILRPKDPDPETVQAALDYARAQVGKDYDYLFRTGKDDAFYCSELAFSAIKQGPRPPRVEAHKGLYGLKPMATNDDLRRSPDLTEVWSKNAPPVGKLERFTLS